MALTDKLTAIADAVREKTGKADEMTLDQMAVEIAGISGGSGGGSSTNGNVHFNHFSKVYKVTADDVANYTAGDKFTVSVDNLKGYARIVSVKLEHHSNTGGSILQKINIINPDPDNKYNNYRTGGDLLGLINKNIAAYGFIAATYIVTEQEYGMLGLGTAAHGSPLASSYRCTYWTDANIYPNTSLFVNCVFNTLVEGLEIGIHVIEEVAE
jgi:hypothetical protein